MSAYNYHSIKSDLTQLHLERNIKNSNPNETELDASAGATGQKWFEQKIHLNQFSKMVHRKIELS